MTSASGPRPASARQACSIALILCGLVAGCGDDGLQLSVDLVTDYLPGRQFVGIRVEVRDEADRMLASDTAFATDAQDFLAGVRIADFEGLAAGTVRTRVTLLQRDGSELVTQGVLIELRESWASTTRITARCQLVTCPGADTSLTACVGGTCVDPRCTPETPEFCGDAGCIEDVQCQSLSGCTAGSCVGGICFVRASDSECAATEYCDLDRGCVLDPNDTPDAAVDSSFPDAGAEDTGTDDAGPDAGSCTATETLCADGIDDDCDGDIDCADSDCNDAACDDSSLCTEGDRCSGGLCVGQAVDCSDGDVCTDDTCDAATVARIRSIPPLVMTARGATGPTNAPPASVRTSIRLAPCSARKPAAPASAAASIPTAVRSRMASTERAAGSPSRVATPALSRAPSLHPCATKGSVASSCRMPANRACATRAGTPAGMRPLATGKLATSPTAPRAACRAACRPTTCAKGAAAGPPLSRTRGPAPATSRTRRPASLDIAAAGPARTRRRTTTAGRASSLAPVRRRASFATATTTARTAWPPTTAKGSSIATRRARTTATTACAYVGVQEALRQAARMAVVVKGLSAAALGPRRTGLVTRPSLELERRPLSSSAENQTG